MKIIELLTLMAEGKKVPKFFKYNYNYFYYRKNDYYCDEYDGWFSVEELAIDNLNDEIEIIEEEKEIEKIDFRTLNTQKEKNRVMKDTINQLIDVINDMRDKEC